MKSLSERLAAANALLAPYAIPHEGILGRVHGEPEDETRFPFQRDRDRIIHTTAFRRLKGKTQVFIPSASDHHRTRLTHTLEVAQISRDIARTLGLNEDLAECIALAHDLGHPPFGHAGEAALNEWMQEHESHFEHNEQSYRIVTLLEPHSSLYKGLNLNQEILSGLLKHHTPHDHPSSPAIPSASMEAQLVNIADEIAYTGHDCDDGQRAGLFTLEEIIDAIPLAKEALDRTEKRGTSLRGSVIHVLVMDLYETTSETIVSQRINTVNAVCTAGTLVRFSDSMRSALDELRGFLEGQMYNHPDILERNRGGQETIRGLCEHLHAHPNEKVLALQEKADGALAEAVKDYVAGMTDAYAEGQLAST